MFGIGGSEILVILIVALLFLGPDKLPDAAKQISKGIRDLKRGSREIQQTIENDETIGGAIRDLKSALRGEEPAPPRAKPKKVAKKIEPIEMEADEPVDDLPPEALGAAPPAPPEAQLSLGLPATDPVAAIVKLPPSAGEADPDHEEGEHDRAELAALIRPASGTVAKTATAPVPAATTEVPADVAPEPKHG